MIPLRYSRGTAAVFSACAAALLLGLGLSGCGKPAITSQRNTRTLPVAIDVRDVRVLLVNRQRSCRIRFTDPITVRPARGGDEVLLRQDRADWSIVRVDKNGAIMLGDHSLGRGPVDLTCQPGRYVELSRREGSKWQAARRYPQTLRFSSSGNGKLSVTNVLDVETYVACVLPGELFPHFARETYRAQAVAVRTYGLFQMALRAGQPYDVNASFHSQVYNGLGTGDAAERAKEATAYTRGIVATWSSPAGERIFCTFYSACCGGTTQSVANCRTDVAEIPPLAGGVHCDCLSIAKGKSYRWGSLRLSKSDVTGKLVAKYRKLKSLGRIEKIETIEKTPAGRAKVLRLRGRGGKYSDMMAEDFRLAVGSMSLRSTDCDITTEPEHFVFANGKGFGHAMGMCQWGAEAMALQGRTAAEILKHYYPTAHLTRAY